MSTLLKVKNLCVDFRTSQGQIEALRDVSFELNEGESLGFVGESGSGKSVTSLAIFDLLASNAVIKSGEIAFKDLDLFQATSQQKQKLRGGEMAMIFQDPMSSLNPSFTVEFQIGEVLKEHLGMKGAAVQDRVVELLGEVGIPDPRSRLRAYPHELSGGMSQRVMIAMAIACRPKLLIADEPTTALDVTIQKQILELISKLQKEQNMALILISHDLGVISHFTKRIQVMYAGEIVESGPTEEILKTPKHPYTEALLKSLPGNYQRTDRRFRLPTIPGVVPNLANRPQGCQLSPRCQYKDQKCETQNPIVSQNGQRHFRCWKPL